MAAEGSSASGVVSLSPKVAYLRLAGPEDAAMVLTLVRELASFEQMLDDCVATEEDLRNCITASPPFKGPTVTLLEVAEAESPGGAAGGGDESASSVALDIKEPVSDPHAASFVSRVDPKRTVVGYVLVFPTMTTFLGKMGLWVEDLYIRAPYRRLGLGRLLLGSVATYAARQNLGRVEWVVLDWNKKAIDFYESMGATVQPQWRVCRLAGDALQSYGDK